MDPIETLLSRAAEKRDAAIGQARRTYRTDVAAINALHDRLPAPPVVDRNQLLAKAPTAVDYVKALAPAEKPFTVSELTRIIRDAHPGEQFHQPTIRTYVSRLRSAGYFRRLRKTGQMEVIYVRAEVPTENLGAESKNMATAAHEVMAEAATPLRLIEIVVLMQQGGYRTDVRPDTLLKSVRSMFRAYPGRFERDKQGRWGLA